MVEFDIVLEDIRLRIICESYKKGLIQELMGGHAFIDEPVGEATYNLLLTDSEISWEHGTYIRMVDKWFDNASCDVWIDNPNKIVYMTNIDAKKNEHYKQMIQYFVCNLFNRLLEEKGYIAFHSSAVEKNGTGLAFIGKRNAGKTNCMLNMMNAGFNSVTNDKLGIQYDGSGLNGYGVAQDVSIRMDLGFRSQEQNQKYLEYARQQGLVLSDENRLEGNNIHLGSVELATLNGVSQVPQTRIEHIIFPTYDGSIEDVIVRQVDSSKAKEIIDSQRLPLVHETKSFFNLVNTGRSPIFDEQETLRQLYNLENYEIVQGEKCTDSFVKILKKIYKGN